MNLRTSLKKRDGASACNYSCRPVRWELELKRDNGTAFTIKFTVTEQSNQASPVAQQSV